MVFWPTLPGRCTTCHGFLTHPVGPVHHLLWFSDPPYRTGAPLAVVCTGALLAVFFTWSIAGTLFAMVFNWPGLRTTCRGFYMTLPAGAVHYLLWISDPPCRAILATAFWRTLPG